MAAKVLEDNVFTFKPKVSIISAKIVESLNSDFMSRQEEHLEKQRRNIRLASLQFTDSAVYEFKKSRKWEKEKINKEVHNTTNIMDTKPEAEAMEVDQTLSEAVSSRSSPGSDTEQEPPAAKMETEEPDEDSGAISDPDHISHSRSKTMPPQNTNLQRKSTSLNFDRLKNAKIVAEKATKNRKVFMIQGPYPAIRQSLRERGWVEKFYRMNLNNQPKKSPRAKKKQLIASDTDDDNTDDDDDDSSDDDPNADDPNDHGCKIPPWEEDNGIYGIMSRVVRNASPSFIWSVRRDVVDPKALKKDQILNHYGKAGSFTTKVGLCVNMRNLTWFQEANPDSYFPRCYKFSQEEEKQAFIDDYRLTACINLLKHVKEFHDKSSKEQDPEMDNDKENFVCVNPECTKSRPNTNLTNRCIHAVSNSDTNTSVQSTPRKGFLMNCSFIKDNKSGCNNSDDDNNNGFCETCNGPLKKKKVIYVPIRAVEIALLRCERYIQCLNHDDLDEEVDSFSLTDAEWDEFIQWYYRVIHDGAIISHISSKMEQITNTLNLLKERWPQYELDGTHNVWMVKAGAKSRGRGIIPYDRLEDMLKAIHLSNNAIQKNYESSPSRSKYLPTENMWDCDQFKDFLRKRGELDKWDTVIYPGMKKAVLGALLCSQDIVEYRKNSFELYGADFMLTEDLTPWLIEVNCSPSMAASTKVTAKLCSSVLADTVKVVIDRRNDKNAETGLFELSYKQPYVHVPPYIGINLTVEGTTVKKPSWMIRKPAAPPTYQEAPSLDLSTKLSASSSKSADVEVKPDSKTAGSGTSSGIQSTKTSASSSTTASVNKVFTQNFTHAENKHASRQPTLSLSKADHKLRGVRSKARSLPTKIESNKTDKQAALVISSKSAEVVSSTHGGKQSSKIYESIKAIKRKGSSKGASADGLWVSVKHKGKKSVRPNSAKDIAASLPDQTLISEAQRPNSTIEVKKDLAGCATADVVLSESMTCTPSNSLPAPLSPISGQSRISLHRETKPKQMLTTSDQDNAENTESQTPLLKASDKLVLPMKSAETVDIQVMGEVQNRGNEEVKEAVEPPKCGPLLLNLGSLPDLRLAEIHALQPSLPFIDAYSILKNNNQLEPISQGPFTHSITKKGKKRPKAPKYETHGRPIKAGHFGIQELPSPHMPHLRIPKFPNMNAGHPIYKLNGGTMPHLRFLKANKSIKRIQEVNTEIEKLHKITASNGMPLYKYR
ncbi:hypothetical protein LSH36_52g05018 [Paralvinella palmiformis]|uniref:Uncharacterized protein n=1 Tax=Paralvinella palmiformis TaxID=53620 RepID=A0AAD9K5G0_9ANNE|nr:hypothetical protein LSH36_52g05018 [Paralvinella palmiformis]